MRNTIKCCIIFGIAMCLNACATPHSAPSPEYTAKDMAKKWRSNTQSGTNHPVHKSQSRNSGKTYYVLPPPAEEGDPHLQDQDSEVNRNRYSYPVYQSDADNPYVYAPPTPNNYPADNDADYYYYPLYFGE
jgi:hypothetical protein